VGGEFVRSDVRDGQKGVELILDTQVINMATCAPVTNAMVEIWHCNATGVYGGIVANGKSFASQLWISNPLYISHDPSLGSNLANE
jgi:protocatechuate 3,4-dioxygenase beta subunit